MSILVFIGRFCNENDIYQLTFDLCKVVDTRRSKFSSFNAAFLCYRGIFFIVVSLLSRYLFCLNAISVFYLYWLTVGLILVLQPRVCAFYID